MGKDDLETADDAEAELNGLMKPKFKRCDERGRTVQINDRTHMVLGSAAKLDFLRQRSGTPCFQTTIGPLLAPDSG